MADNDKDNREDEGESNESLLNDVAITAEFEYQEDWDSLRDLPESEEDEKNGRAKSDQEDKSAKKTRSGASSDQKNNEKTRETSQGDSISRALDDFDSYLDEDSDGRGGQANSADFVDEADSREMPAPDLANGNRSSPGAWGYDQPQVSGVFSRYEEETSSNEEEDFDLFAEDSSDEPQTKTLQELTSDHEKKIRRLRRQLDYQKEVLQVMAELLVEARVISRRELKRRLKELRHKNS